MKANEFVKKFGWDFCNEFSKKGYEIQEIYPNDIGIGFIDDLKRLVESHELVEKCGGLRKVKDHIKQGNVYRFEEKPLMVQAISDVETCQ